uniref:(California timema) hypothetical protein n=1 Tax=Timema californicum TaxID=61474 RepID=A0A7R9PCE8_TIMCA|nr:unnamed protein product [Timema californicum]
MSSGRASMTSEALTSVSLQSNSFRPRERMSRWCMLASHLTERSYVKLDARNERDVSVTLQVPNVTVTYVVQAFDEKQSVAITEVNAAISCSSVSADLAYVKRNFGNFPGAITTLKARDLPLVKAVKIIRGIEENLNQASGSVGTVIIDQFNRVLQ